MDQNKDGQIEIDEWRSFVSQNPNMIKFMTILSLRYVQDCFYEYTFFIYMLMLKL